MSHPHLQARDDAGPTPADLAELGRGFWDLLGEAESLAGEADLNVKLRVGDQVVVLKATPPGTPREDVELQAAVLDHLAGAETGLHVPAVLPTRSGESLVTGKLPEGEYVLRVLSFVEGRLLADVRPRTDGLVRGLGAALGRLDRALEGFEHPHVDRELTWDLRHGLEVVAARREHIDPAKRELFDRLERRVRRELSGRTETLPSAVVHNDANDHNVLVAEDLDGQRVHGLIDFGDLVRTWRVAEPAIAAAYAGFGREDVLTPTVRIVEGYLETHRLEDAELDVLAELAILRLLVSVVMSASRKLDAPDDPYVTISEAPAWAALESWTRFPAALARAALRAAAGREPRHDGNRLRAALASSDPTPVIEIRGEAVVLDLGVSGSLSVLLEEGKYGDASAEIESRTAGGVGLGRWMEPRCVVPGGCALEYGRNLGTELFVGEGTVVRTPLDGEVVGRSEGPRGLRLTLELALEGDAPVWLHLAGLDDRAIEVGTRVTRGEAVGYVAPAYPWPAHLHVQLVLEPMETPRLGDPSQLQAWRALAPDPAPLLGLASTEAEVVDPAAVRARREAHAVRSLSLSYRNPLTIVRGRGRHLLDHEGRRYLDGVNNVPHVGHSHPRVVEAAVRQMRSLNTNTRYLHPLFGEYAERLAATLPDPLSVVFLVNSGSEANELALRLARTHTGSEDFLVVDGGYHGNTGALVDLSPYKHDGPGGSGAPSHVHKVEMPDPFRGRFRSNDPEAGVRYADDVRRALSVLAGAGRAPAALLAEPLLGCGGQIVPPPGWLESAYGSVREAGGLAIADEVQIGFGRVGRAFWGFELQGVVPDIVTLGKPIGNGHPMGAVVTTPEIASSFVTGMEYFNTFGGNPVSCAIGLAVLDVIEEEGLVENARRVGDHLLAGLEELVARHPLAADARGVGLYLGLELVRDHETLEPAAAEASYVANRAKEEGVLISTDGPHHNVLKLKPPIVFTEDDADRVVELLDSILGDSVLARGAVRTAN